MNVDFSYARRSINAAFGLALRDQNAWAGFDLTANGFFRSFAALLIVMPLNVLYDMLLTSVLIGKKIAAGEQVAGSYEMSDAVFSTITLCAQWMIFPIAMIFVLRFLGLAHRYGALIIAHNWSSVVIILAYLPGYALYAIGLVSADVSLDLAFIVFGLTLYYRFYIAQTALDAGISTAGAVTILDLLLQIYFIVGVERTAALWLPAAS
ncbi:MAG: hypothetical protein K8S25_03740 [Alphaproteobacteria bacterium]|nr:hypothetical protein [Alphaproteobacteria bacterium]